MTRKILINLAIPIGLLAFLLPNSYLLAGGVGWEKMRNPGDPLDGYWYMSGDGVPGCFDDLVVYEIKAGKFAQVLRGNKLDAPIRFSEGQELIIEFDRKPNVTSRFYVEDRGQVLWAYRYQEQSGGVNFTQEEAMPLLTTCDNPSTMGVLASLVSKVFDPDDPTNKVTIRRKN